MSNPDCKSPWERLHGVKSDISKFRVFGETCEVPYTPAAHIDNGDLHPRTSWLDMIMKRGRRGIYFLFHPGTKLYRVTKKNSWVFKPL